MTKDNHPKNTLHAGVFLFLILGAISALTPFAIDMYLPSMPTIAKDLNVEASAVQFTLTAYTLGFAFGQVINGPLADSYGRRPVLLIGSCLFTVAAVMSAMSTGIEELTLIRVLQGFAGAASAVIIQALTRDLFDKEDFARAMSFVTLVMMVAPLIAPMIGGYFAVWFGWRSIFWFLAAYAFIVVILIAFKIPETLKEENKQPLRFKTIIRNFVRLIRNPVAFGIIMTGAFSFSGMFVFLTTGSFVYIGVFGVTPEVFGYLFGLNVLTLVVMTLINGRFVKKVGSHTMLRFGLTIKAISALGLFSAWGFDWGLWGIVPFVMLYIGTLSTIGSNTSGLLLSSYPHMAGTAASLSGSLRFGIGGAIGGLVALLPTYEIWPMVLTMSLCAVISILFYFTLGRKA
ncbi:Bcr/CflA family multidrug efflux MFS transporter [Vibrio sp.]|nr:Bcr/CflA family multidrug efflux MFS transporter [Vibrio sp.]